MIDLITNVIFLVVTIAFLGVYIYSLILNLVRALKTNKQLKNDPQVIEGTVVEVIPVKKRVYIKVQFTSQSNHQTFDMVYELTQAEFKDQYYVNQKVKIYYPKIEGNDKIHCFPTYLEGKKITPQAGPIFTDALITASGIFITLYSLFSMISKGAFKGNVPLIASSTFTTDAEVVGTFNIFSFFIFLIIYLVLLSYLIERIVGISREHSESYLKIYGLLVKAEVTTYKLMRTKNAQGVRQARVKISFSTNKGEKVESEIYSFLYTENPEQYISILYDPRRPQMAVYLKG